MGGGIGGGVMGGGIGGGIGGGASGTAIGGGVAGVASKSEWEGIMIYNTQTLYKKWEFVFDASQVPPIATERRTYRVHLRDPDDASTGAECGRRRGGAGGNGTFAGMGQLGDKARRWDRAETTRLVELPIAGRHASRRGGARPASGFPPGAAVAYYTTITEYRASL